MADKNEIEYLKEQLEKQTKKNKKRMKTIKLLETEREANASEYLKKLKGFQKTITNQTLSIKELQEKSQNLDSHIKIEPKQSTNLSIEAPYVHVKITKILGGKGKKGEISLSAGGSIEKLNVPDVETFSEVMLQKMNEKIDYALQELQKDEETE